MGYPAPKQTKPAETAGSRPHSAWALARACAGGDVGLLCLSHVGYRSGALADVETITREAGVRVLWDLSHSVGVVPIELTEWGVELAVGCTYKYLNAGPGAPAFLYVREELQEDLRTPIQGWFGQHDQFRMERPYDPAPGVRGFLAGTPTILALGAVEEGVKLVAEAGIDRLRILGPDDASGRGASLAAGKYISKNIYLEVVTDARGFTATQLEVTLSRSLSILSQAGGSNSTNVNVRYRKNY